MRLSYLDGLSLLEPQHQPPEVEGIRTIARIHPDMKQVAVFDTSLHRTMPETAQLYAVPKSVLDEGCGTGAITTPPTTTSIAPCRSTIPMHDV